MEGAHRVIVDVDTFLSAMRSRWAEYGNVGALQ